MERGSKSSHCEQHASMLDLTSAGRVLTVTNVCVCPGCYISMSPLRFSKPTVPVEGFMDL